MRSNQEVRRLAKLYKKLGCEGDKGNKITVEGEQRIRKGFIKMGQT